MTSPFDKLQALRDKLPVGAAPVETTPKKGPGPLSGKVVVRHERKGRGGKTATIVSGVRMTPDELATFCRDLKKALGCGATVESDAKTGEPVIALQGDLVDRTLAWLEKQGATKLVRGSG